MHVHDLAFEDQDLQSVLLMYDQRVGAAPYQRAFIAPLRSLDENVLITQGPKELLRLDAPYSTHSIILSHAPLSSANLVDVFMNFVQERDFSV
jgi:hypothetical protein